MSNESRNGRNVGSIDENRPSYRSYDDRLRDDERWRDRNEDRYATDRDRDRERWGGGEPRSAPWGSRESRLGRHWEDARDEGYRMTERFDDRFTGRGPGYWEDRQVPMGYGRSGGHRGKGPKGYTRSDERIRELVSEALSDDDQVDATNVDVVVENGEVILTGTIGDRRMKRLAEDCVERVSGVKDVQNQLRVQEDTSNRSVGGTVSRDDKKHRA